MYTLPIISMMKNDNMMPIKKFAEANNIGHRTAYRYWQQGLLDGVKLPTGTILIRGWNNNEKDSKNNSKYVIIFLRTNEEDYSLKLQALNELAKEKGLKIKETILWKGFAFEPNPYLDEILESKVKYIITDKLSDLFGINFEIMSKMFENNGHEVIALNNSDNIHLTIKGLIGSSSKMAKVAVGMNSYKKDLSHYINNLLK